jgi:hypothetical protein
MQQVGIFYLYFLKIILQNYMTVSKFISFDQVKTDKFLNGHIYLQNDFKNK